MMYIFDVDGTLTPSRCLMDSDFKEWFVKNIKTYCLVTGSDKDKTIEQVGEDVWSNAEFSFNCNGNDTYFKGNHLYTNEWILPEDAHEWLSEQLTASNYNIRTGLHFEHRPGMVNFSVVGRNATSEQRKDYVAYDEYTDERAYIAHNFNLIFTELEAKVGGETGIDISSKGADKSQVLNFLLDKDYTDLHFFGDRMDKDGNDYPLAKAILDKSVGKCYYIKDYLETWNTLERL